VRIRAHDKGTEAGQCAVVTTRRSGRNGFREGNPFLPYGDGRCGFVKRFWWIGILVGCVVGGVVWLLLWHGGHVYHGSGYAVTYPKDWKVIQFRLVDVAFVAPESADEQGFRSNINIVVVPRGDDISTTGKVFQNIITSLDVPENHFVLLGKQDLEINGRKCSSLQYTIFSQGQKLKGTIYIVDALKTYIFSYTTLEPLHPRFMAAFTAMVASLQNA